MVLGGRKLSWDEFPVMTSRILTLAGILCLMGSADVGWAMVRQGTPCLPKRGRMIWALDSAPRANSVGCPEPKTTPVGQ